MIRRLVLPILVLAASLSAALAQGLRTPDIHEAGSTRVGTEEMGNAVVAALG